MPAMTKLRSAGVVALAFPLFAAIAVRGFAPPSSPSSATLFVDARNGRGGGGGVLGGGGGGAPPTTSFRRAVVDASRAGPSRPSSRAAAATEEVAEAEAAPAAAASGVSNKLLAETIAPFRGLRLFFYAALASGALAGGLITLSGVIAAASGGGVSPDAAAADAQYANLAIDFGSAAALGVLAKLDLDGGARLDAAVEEKVRRRGEMRKVAREMRERESALAGLSLGVRTSADDDDASSRVVAPVGVVQEKARQHLVLVAGPGRAVRDALRGAQLNRSTLATANVLVVTYETTAPGARPGVVGGGGGGFGAGARPSYETQAHVAEPVGDGWGEFVNAEIDAAVDQSGEGAREDGIALVVASDGRVLRRGVGKVPWRQVVDELGEAVTGEKKKGTTVPFLEYLE
jgi:hypothetical protein